jgi:hypothetical protein
MNDYANFYREIAQLEREATRGRRSKPRPRGKSDVTPTSWAYAAPAGLEDEASPDAPYEGPSAQEIGARSPPAPPSAADAEALPARRLGAPQREQWAPEDWRALSDGQPADDPLANIRARTAQIEAGRQSDRPAWEAAAGRVLPEETQPAAGAPFQTYYDSHFPLIIEGPRRLAEEAISLGADSLTWPIDQGARDRMDNRAEFLGRFARGLGDAVGNMSIGEDTSIAGRERQAAEQERNFQRNIRLNDYAEQIRRPERYLGTAEPLDVTVQGPLTGERVGRFIDETVGYRGTEEFLRDPEAQYQGADFLGDVARERENARRLGVSPENMPDTSMAPLPSDQYESQAQASSVPVGLTVGLSALEFAPGVGLVPDLAAAGRATARGVGRDAWRLGQRVGALDATDELPYAFVAREGAEDAPGLLTGQYRDRVRTPVIAAGVTGAGVEAADDNFGDDPLASSIAAGSAAALTRRLGGAEAESGVRRVAARRLSEGSGAEPINAEFFPTNQPAEMAVREYQPAEGTVVRVEPDGRVVMTYQGAYQSGASDARAAGSGAEAVRTWRATLRALEDDIAATQRPEYHWTPGPDGAPDERLAQFYREAMSRRAPEGYVFSETPDGVMHLTRERPVRFGEELDMRTGQIRPASPIDLEAPDLRLADDLQLGNYPRRDPAPQSESSNGIPPRRLGATDAPDAGPVGGETLLSAETGQMRPEGALSLQAARTGGNIGEINGVQRLGDTAVRRGVTETTDLLGEQPQPLERINGDLLGLQGAGVNFPTNQGQRSVGSSHQLPPRHEAANVDGTSAGSQHRQPRTRASYEEAIEKARQDYDYVGFRTDDGPLSPELRSRVWDDGEPTGEMLDGLSVTDVNAPEVWSMHNFEPPRRGGHYFGENTYVIAGNRAYAGRDRGELVITDPVIILDPARARAAPTRIPWTAPDGGARGGEQFDTSRVVYRGLGRQYDPANGGYYQSFTSSLDDAREYGSNVVAAHIRPGRNLAVDGGGRNFNVLGVEQLPADVRARLHPSVGETATTDQIAHAAREAGYDSVTVRNVHDNRWGERQIAGAEPRTIDFVFSTENIRPLDSVPPQATGARPASGEKVRLSAADRALLDELLGPDAPTAGPRRLGQSEADVGNVPRQDPPVEAAPRANIPQASQRRWQAAVRDPQTGRVYTGEDHLDAIESAPTAAIRARLEAAYTAGAEDPNVIGFSVEGQFMSREEGLAAMRNAAGRGPATARPVLNAERELAGGEPGTNADFLDRLPTDASQWREVVGAHPWINSPSRAQLVIMSNARDASGRFIYSTDDILQATGIVSEASLNAQRSQARAAGVPLPTRNRGANGATSSLGGQKVNDIVDLMERVERQGSFMTSAEIAERLGLKDRSAVDVVMSQVAKGHRAVPPELLARVRAILQRRQERRAEMGLRGTRARKDDPLAAVALATGATGASIAMSDEANAEDVYDAIDRYGSSNGYDDPNRWQIVPPRGESIPSVNGMRVVSVDGEYAVLEGDGRVFRAHVMRGFDQDANQPSLSLNIVGELVPAQESQASRRLGARTNEQGETDAWPLVRPIASTAVGTALGFRLSRHPTAGALTAGASAAGIDAIAGGREGEPIIAGSAAAGLRGLAPQIADSVAAEAAARGPEFEARRRAFAMTLPEERPELRGTQVRGDEYLGTRGSIETDQMIEQPWQEPAAARVIVPGQEMAEQGYSRRLGVNASPREQFEALSPAGQLQWMDDAERQMAEREARLVERLPPQRRLGGPETAPQSLPRSENAFPVGFYDPATGQPLFGSSGRKPPPRAERRPIDELRSPGTRLGKNADERVQAARDLGVVREGEQVSGAEAVRRIMERARQDQSFRDFLRERYPAIAMALLGGATGSEMLRTRRLGEGSAEMAR